MECAQKKRTCLMSKYHQSHAYRTPYRICSTISIFSYRSVFWQFLLGVTCAFYLEEWLPGTNWVRCLIENQVSILSGIPSLLYGLLAGTIFLPYSGVFKTTEASLSDGNLDMLSLKTTIFQGDKTLFYTTGLTFVLLVMPRTIKTTQEALRSVPISIRESVYALGASPWQVLIKHVVPLAFPRILAGGCRALSCALATAALFIGIYIWELTTHAGEMPDIFALFLGGALLLSIFSSFLIERYPPVFDMTHSILLNNLGQGFR